ncbi:hypothetical protein WN943_029262 [Citrus x changshan-huyou]
MDVHEELLRGQAEVWQFMFAFTYSMALKSAVELRLADIMHSHGCPITLSQLASRIDSSCPDISHLARIMRMLVYKGIFAAHHPSDGGDETMYGTTHISKWLLHDSELSLAPMILVQNNQWLLAPWHYLSQCVKKGGTPFRKAHGSTFWDFASQNPQFNNLFNEAMACTTKITMKAFVSHYKVDGFNNIRSMVDVGGGTGTALAEIVKSHPHIKGINFDLQHVIATAPMHEGVSHVGGDMFDAIPNADAVLMKWILHDWGDEACIKILKNCRKAIPEKIGKVIIVDIVLQPDGSGLFDETRLVFDLLMMVDLSGGKERTELEWKKILEKGGFPRHRIIKIPALQSIIEAYPE